MNHYKHITLSGVQYIQLVNPEPCEKDCIVIDMNCDCAYFSSENQPIIWYGEAFDGEKDESEVEFYTELYYDTPRIQGWYPVAEERIHNKEYGLEKGYLRIASRPKEVEQPVQQEENAPLYKEGEFVFHNQLGTVQVVEVLPGTSRGEQRMVVHTNHYEKTHVWQRDCEPVQPSTPIVEEQTLPMPFEAHPELTDYIQEMASTGKAPRSWTAFIECLNQSLSNREEGREPSIERINKYGRHQFNRGCMGLDLVPFEQWAELSPSSPLEQKELKSDDLEIYNIYKRAKKHLESKGHKL